MQKSFLITLLLFSFLEFFAQDHTTTAVNKKTELSNSTSNSKKKKIMLVPFERKMYMSQIDHKINAETKLTQRQIMWQFRDGVDEQLYKKLKTKFEVISLISDTIKYAKDIAQIYQYTTHAYEKVPNQDKYRAPEKVKPPTTIKNGQLIMSSNAEDRFMNAKVSNPTLIPNLYAKYKTEIFVFINQVDIISGQTTLSEDPGVVGSRTLTIHYTVYTVDAKELNSGICTVLFPPNVNTTDKIIGNYVSIIASEIASRIEKSLAFSVSKK